MIIEDGDRPVGPKRTVAATDNRQRGVRNGLDAAILRMARLIGWPMALDGPSGAAPPTTIGQVKANAEDE